jgi:hemerythrin
MNCDFHWNHAMDVGHERIDLEHRMFLALIKNISDAFHQKKSREYLTRLLIELERYASFHFCSEENIALDHGETAPEFSAHRRIHDYLLKELRSRIRRHHAGQEDPLAIVSFLVDWFNQHTRQDRARVCGFATAGLPLPTAET